MKSSLNIHLSEHRISMLKEAALNSEPVAGLTHNFYRYPARFSPVFVREAIKLFTEVGDLVFDPFMGGGTSLVEACALGRRAVGTDISGLATFVSKVKTTPLSRRDIEKIMTWTDKVGPKLNLYNLPFRHTEWIKRGYQRNISGKKTWPIRKTLELALSQLNTLVKEPQRLFIRCVLLRTAQWALDCKTTIPQAKEFRRQFFDYLVEMIEGLKAFSADVRTSGMGSHHKNASPALCLQRSVTGIENEFRLMNLPAPRLILTSPPYPGVHVLYHRWQIQGRRETPAPFWIANCHDGMPESFYTFGNRKQRYLRDYFTNLLETFTSAAKVANKNTIMVQMVAFSSPSWQLPEYLKVMERAGFIEVRVPKMGNAKDGRLWRNVPNRKWYAHQRRNARSDLEVVLIHRRA